MPLLLGPFPITNFTCPVCPVSPTQGHSLQGMQQHAWMVWALAGSLKALAVFFAPTSIMPPSIGLVLSLCLSASGLGTSMALEQVQPQFLRQAWISAAVIAGIPTWRHCLTLVSLLSHSSHHDPRVLTQNDGPAVGPSDPTDPSMTMPPPPTAGSEAAHLFHHTWATVQAWVVLAAVHALVLPLCTWYMHRLALQLSGRQAVPSSTQPAAPPNQDVTQQGDQGNTSDETLGNGSYQSHTTTEGQPASSNLPSQPPSGGVYSDEGPRSLEGAQGSTSLGPAVQWGPHDFPEWGEVPPAPPVPAGSTTVPGAAGAGTASHVWGAHPGLGGSTGMPMSPLEASALALQMQMQQLAAGMVPGGIVVPQVLQPSTMGPQQYTGVPGQALQPPTAVFVPGPPLSQPPPPPATATDLQPGSMSQQPGGALPPDQAAQPLIPPPPPPQQQQAADAPDVPAVAAELHSSSSLTAQAQQQQQQQQVTTQSSTQSSPRHQQFPVQHLQQQQQQQSGSPEGIPPQMQQPPSHTPTHTTPPSARRSANGSLLPALLPPLDTTHFFPLPRSATSPVLLPSGNGSLAAFSTYNPLASLPLPLQPLETSMPGVAQGLALASMTSLPATSSAMIPAIPPVQIIPDEAVPPAYQDLPPFM
jgi:hypothetical protein